MPISKHFLELESVLTRRGFIWGPEPEIYGGLAGFYSLGPNGMAVKRHILSIIRRHFISNGFDEVECPTIMPRAVWEGSGHLERFTDPVVTCNSCGKRFRADTLIEENGVSLTTRDAGSLTKIISEKSIKCPDCKGTLSDVKDASLMIKTTIGIDTEAYLRPETATTTYLLFPRLYVTYRNKLPIMVFQYGKAYRNEISPRKGVLRLREFEQFEAQVFLLESMKEKFEDFSRVSERKINMWPATYQESGKGPEVISIRDALEKKIIRGEAYAWTLGITHEVIEKLGYDLSRVRFRQHCATEKAHYAHDAWDVEVETDQYGWVEICGVHDRGDYDLKRHQQYSGISMEVDGKIPHILEIAFGLERTTYTLLDQSFIVEEDRALLRLSPNIAPVRVAVFPLIARDERQQKIANEIYSKLKSMGIETIFDDSGSIGKRYRRADEIGVPWCITVDNVSVENGTVTIRDRDSMKQQRYSIDKAVEFITEKILTPS